MGNFRFKFVLQISRQINDKSEFEILQSKSGVIWGQNPKIFKPGQIIYQNGALGLVVKNNGFRGALRSSDLKLGVFRVVRGQNPKIFRPGQIIYQNGAHGPAITTSGLRVHQRSPYPKSGVFGVILCQNPKIFKLRQVNYKNGALARSKLLPWLRKIVFDVFREHLTLKLWS